MVVKYIPRSDNPDKWKIRFGEDDSDTRDNRKGRKANVTTLAPKLAIVNVYELFNKKSSRLEAKRAAQGVRKKGTGSGKTKVPREPREKKVINPGAYGYRLGPYQEVDGEMLNVTGNPVTIEGEDRKTYNRRVAAWRRKKGLPVSTTTEETASTKPTQEEEAKTAEQQSFSEDFKQQKEDAARKLKAQQAKEPRYILYGLVKKYNITTESGIKKYETPKSEGGFKEAYSQRNPLDAGDAARIERAIANGIREKRIPQPKGQPPAVVAIQPTTSEPPKWYYIRNDLSENRRRKMMAVKAKRPVKKQISHGNKRRVVMKKKGGKR